MEKEKINILLYGLGAIGSFYAFILHRTNRVRLTVVARSNYEAVIKNGIYIDSANHGQHRFHPDLVIKSPSEVTHPYHYIICANKAIDQDAVAAQLAPAVDNNTTFVIIQNGVGNEEPFRRAFPACSILTCVTWVGATQTSPGVITHIKSEDMQIGLFPNPSVEASVENSRLEEFTSFLAAGGTKFQVVEDMQLPRWEKVVWNAAWNSITALTMVDTQTWLTSSADATPLTRRLMGEVIAVGRGCGVDLDKGLVSSSQKAFYSHAIAVLQMRGCLQLARWLSAAPKGTAASLTRAPFVLANAPRYFTSSASRAGSRSTATKPLSDLEKRISAIPIERYRNFCIVAHVDHGKSTLSDRLLELTGTIEPGSNKQVLDKLDVERERGITVKAQTCSMIYNHNGEDYLLHLVDTPGHVDFRAEVSRSYASCGGALLLVDASQGIQAQTVANFYLAFAQGLELIPVINKVDLPSAEPERALEQMKNSFELDTENAVMVSAKTGLNVEKLLPTVIEKIPAPIGDCKKPLRMLLVDSWYDSYKGVICLVRIFDGEIRAGQQVVSFATGLKYYVGEAGIMYPNETPQSVLRAGQVGYIYFNPGMKRSKEAKIGDTFTRVGFEKAVEPLPGFEEPKAMVFVAAYPVDADHFEHLEDSINQLVLNDRSITVQKESSEALGAGFRLGFLGTLHCSVFEDRLRQEHGASIIITPPSVPVKIIWKDGKEEIITSPAKFPEDEELRSKVAEIQEPYVLATLTFPEEYLGKVIELCEANRGEQKSLEYFTPTQVILKYELPLAQLVDDFFGKLKGSTKGYASLDYEESAWQTGNIVKLQLLVNKAPVDAVARIVHSSQVERLGRQWVTKFKEHVDRQLFEVVIQAAVGKKIIARETVKPYRKDVLAKLHASDVSRRRKLLEKQKEGRKRLRAVGNVVIEHKAFQAFLAK